MEGGRFSSGRPIKRACGLCAGLAGAPIEVKFNGLGGFSNPDYPYVNCCGLTQALVKKWKVSSEEGEKNFGAQGPVRSQGVL